MPELLSWLETNGQRAATVFLATFVVAVALTALVIKIARARGLVATPSSERWHQRPTALFGGVAIFLAAMLAAFLFLPLASHLIGLTSGALFIFIVGLYDDFKPLRPAHKFVAQLVAACFFAAVFYGAGHPPTYVWLVPFAIVWIVGITNAFNLLDNMDGLSAGVAALVALLMAAHAAILGNTGLAISALIICGAACGFLVFNFSPARIFMGDCGSMFLGYSLSCLTLMGDSELLSGNLFTAVLLPTLALATPIFDTIFVSCVRFLNGRPISQGGRDHTSHRLVMLGLSERRAVCWLYAVTLWFGLILLWGSTVKNYLATTAITLLSAIALMVLGLFLAEVQTYSEEEYERAQSKRRGEKAILSRMILHKRRFVEAFLDFGLICACWITAFLLRFESHFASYIHILGIVLPYIIACQMTAFYAVGLYRSLWRYATIGDLESAVRGVLVGTIAASFLIFCFAPIKAFPWSIMVIHGILLLLATVGVRVGLKALRFHFAVQWRDGSKRALVIGAGDAGELVVREMFHNKTLQLQPVGFLDDDPAKHHATIYGVRVLGPRSQLLNVVTKMNVDEVIIAMPSIGNGAVQEVVDICREHGITHREVRGILL